MDPKSGAFSLQMVAELPKPGTEGPGDRTVNCETCVLVLGEPSRNPM